MPKDQARPAPRKRGRPISTGPSLVIGVRLHRSELETLDQWINARDVSLTRPVALRALMERGLKDEDLTVSPEARTFSTPAAPAASQDDATTASRRTRPAPAVTAHPLPVLDGLQSFRLIQFSESHQISSEDFQAPDAPEALARARAVAEGIKAQLWCGSECLGEWTPPRHGRRRLPAAND